MSKITYADKVALNSNAGIPAQNKVNDSDMNNIKNAINQIGSYNVATAVVNGDFKVNLKGTLAIGDIINVSFPAAISSTSNARISIDNGSNYYNIKTKSGKSILAWILQNKCELLYFDGTNFVNANPIKRTLWTNPSPTSSFSSQNVTILNNSSFDDIECRFDHFVPFLNYMTTGRIFKPVTYGTPMSAAVSSNPIICRTRFIKENSSTQYNFNDATSNGTTDNSKIVPLVIYGYID